MSLCRPPRRRAGDVVAVAAPSGPVLFVSAAHTCAQIASAVAAAGETLDEIVPATDAWRETARESA